MKLNNLFLTIVFVISVAVLFFVAGISFKHVSQLNKSQKLEAHTYEVKLELEKFFSAMKSAETNNRGYVITKDSTFLQSVENSKKELFQNIKAIKNLTKDNPKQLEHIIQIEKITKERLYILQKLVQISTEKSTQDPEFQRYFIEGRNKMDSINLQIADMTRHETELLEERKLMTKKDMMITPIIIYIILLWALLMISLAFIKIYRNLNKIKSINKELMLKNHSSQMTESIANYGTWQWHISDNTYVFSDNLYRIFGFEPTESKIDLEDFMIVVHPDDRDLVIEKVQEMQEKKHFTPFRHRIIRANDGEIRYILINNKLVTDGYNKEYLLVTTTDITDHIKAKQLLENRNRELEASNKELSAFNYIASHDLQEPLRKIETFISRLLDKDYQNISDSGKQYIERIKYSAGRMRLLINDLLQFSRTNRTDQAIEHKDLNELFDLAIQELSQRIDDTGATIHLNSTLPTLQVVPFQIQQVFINLIGNSIKYSKQDVPPVVNIDVEKVDHSSDVRVPDNKEKYYKITFRDNGIGFKQEYAERIFGLFNRLHNKDEYIGTGIGLSICKKIVENHHGFIFAEGKPDIGSEFTVYLPDKA
ncbi:MAG: CHASE3 domain-containing protein [Cloacibacterium sp.]|nr:CHASE3 domain-containing protein [Cloacibacterium sp.]